MLTRRSSAASGSAQRRRLGTMIGRPVRGSWRTSASRPKMSSSISAVNTSRASPSATIGAVLHHHDEVAVAGGQVEVVQHHHDGAAALAVEPADQVEHLDLVGEVEVRRGLVEQQHVGVLGQRHRDPGALALTAGQLVERPVAQVAGVGHRQRRLDDASSSGDHWRNQRWCGCRPRPTRSRTIRPSGANGLCGSSASRRGDVAGRHGVDRLAVEEDPAGGRLEQPGHRAQQRRLAAAVGPDDRRHPAVGDREVEVADDGVVAVPDGDGLGAQTCAGDRGVVMRRPSRLVRRRSQIRYGAPIADVTMPAGRANGMTTRVTRSAPTTRTAPKIIDASIGGREPPVSRSAICGHHERHELQGPDRGDRDRGQADGGHQDQQLGGLQPHAEAAGGVVAELHRVEDADQQQRDRQEHGQRPQQRHRLIPAAAVERAVEPDLRAGGVLDAGPDQQPRRAGNSRAEADADQDQPLAVDAAAPGEQRRAAAVASAPANAASGTPTPGPAGGQPAAVAGARRARSPNDRADAAPSVTPRMSGLASGLRAKV